MRLDGSLIKLPADADNGVLGELLIEALAKSRSGVPYPKDPNAGPDPFKEAGFKSWNDFAKEAMSCGVECDGQNITFVPERRIREGRSISFAATKVQHKFSIPFRSSPDEIGAAARKALALCEAD